MFNYTERKQFKDKKFQITNEYWGKGKFNSTKTIGCMNSIFKDFYEKNKSIFDKLTCDDFAKYYFTEYKNLKEIRNISIQFLEYCKSNKVSISKKEAFYYTIIRIIDETWEGFNKEIEAIKYLEKLYPDFDIKFSTENDCKYCIDIEIYYDDIFLDCFQVKPISYYYGILKKALPIIKSYRYNYYKHKEFYELNKIKPCYLIYGDEYKITNYDELVDKSYLYYKTTKGASYG